MSCHVTDVMLPGEAVSPVKHNSNITPAITSAGWIWHTGTTEEDKAQKTKSECDNKTTLEKKTAPLLPLLPFERWPPQTSMRS